MPQTTELKQEVRLEGWERRQLCTEIGHLALMLALSLRDPEDQVMTASLSEQTEPSSPLKRLTLLETLWPNLESTLRVLCAAPDRRLTSDIFQVPLTRSHGSPTTLQSIAHRPTDQRTWLTLHSPEAADAAATVWESRPASTTDTAANRLVAAFLNDFTQETCALSRLAQFWEETDAANRADDLTRKANHWRAKEPFVSCSLSAASTRQISERAKLLRCSPPYRKLSSLLQSYESGLRLDWTHSDLLRLPLVEEWYLYEIWCFLRVGRALCTCGWRPVQSDIFTLAGDKLRLGLVHGRQSRLRFHRTSVAEQRESEETLELFYQPLFPSANRRTDGTLAGIRSRSHSMQPDIALHRNGRLWLLDPKFRAYALPGEEQDDINKMHTYRDAIITLDADGQPIQPVCAAWCLFPGTAEEAHPAAFPVRAYPTATAESPLGTAGVGAVRLRPGGEDTELRRLLTAWLQVAP